MKRYEVKGIHGLYDRPKSGRPRKVSLKAIISIISKFKKNSLTPVVLQQKILKTTKVNYHTTHVRKIMHARRLSAKLHKRFTSMLQDLKEVEEWQRYIKKRISYLKKMGFIIAMLDEAFFKREMKAGRKYWSLVGKRIFLPYVGKHQSLAVLECSQIMENRH